jgi:predicted nucleic acid-binding protein
MTQLNPLEVEVAITSATVVSTAVVLDTNIVLDLWVFQDPAAAALLQALESGETVWWATTPMREELARVLDYPHIQKRLLQRQLSPKYSNPDLPQSPDSSAADWVLREFDRLAKVVEVPPKAPITCKDPDDQKFIDLAVAQGCHLLSKDRAVLCMHKRLEQHGVRLLEAADFKDLK